MGKVRPTSPFLSIYRPQVGSIFSIFERITGVILTVVLVLFLFIASFKSIGLSYYPVYSIVFDLYKGSFASFKVSFLFVFVLLSFTYHLLFGIRHLFWGYTGGTDANFRLNLEGLYKISKLLVIGTVVITVLVWVII